MLKRKYFDTFNVNAHFGIINCNPFRKKATIHIFFFLFQLRSLDECRCRALSCIFVDSRNSLTEHVSRSLFRMNCIFIWGAIMSLFILNKHYLRYKLGVCIVQQHSQFFIINVTICWTQKLLHRPPCYATKICMWKWVPRWMIGRNEGSKRMRWHGKNRYNLRFGPLLFRVMMGDAVRPKLICRHDVFVVWCVMLNMNRTE